MHAGAAVNWDAIVQTTFSTHLGHARVEGQGATVGWIMCVGAARANFVVGDEFQDVRGAQLGNSAAEIEWKVVSLETFGSAEGARASGSLGMGCGGVTRRFGFGIGRSILNRFDSYIHGGKVVIEKGRVGSIILFQLVHILGKELERGWGSDVGRIFASEVHELVVEGGHHLHGEASHGVLDQVQSDGNVVEVFHVMELLDALQIG